MSRPVGSDGTMMVHVTSSCQSVQWLALMVQSSSILLMIILWLAVTAALAGDNCPISNNDCSGHQLLSSGCPVAGNDRPVGVNDGTISV